MQKPNAHGLPETLRYHIIEPLIRRLNVHRFSVATYPDGKAVGSASWDKINTMFCSSRSPSYTGDVSSRYLVIFKPYNLRTNNESFLKYCSKLNVKRAFCTMLRFFF